MNETPKLVVHGKCLPPARAPQTLRCQCGFLVSTQSLPAAIAALTDHRERGCRVEACA